MGTASRDLVGGGGNSYFLKRSTNICPLNATECLKSVSLRGKMIPEELEKQIGQARTEVRGAREKEGKTMSDICMCLGLRERVPARERQQPDPCLCVGQRRGNVRMKIG